MSRYFCHNCNIRIERINDDFTCPTCSGGFIEELDDSQEGHDFPGLAPHQFNPLDFLQLIGFDTSQTRSPTQQQSRSQPLSPTSGAAGGGLSGGTPNTLSGAAAAAPSSQSQNARSRRGRGPYPHHGPQFSFVIDGRQMGGGGGGGGLGGMSGGATGGEGAMENMFISFLSDLITGLGGTIPLSGNINLGDYAWGREGLDAIVTQLMNNMEGTGPPPMTEDKLSTLSQVQITSDQVAAKLQCSVCWEDFKVEENVIRLECEHVYHPDCILPWLKLHATCPVCRKDLNLPDTARGEGKPESSDSIRTDSMNNSQPQQQQPAAAAAAAAASSTSSASASRPYSTPRALDEDMEFD